MATATADLRNVNKGVSSAATILGPKGTGDILNASYNVYPGVKIRLDKPEITVVVIRSFVIELTATEEGFMAASRISNSFELGSTLYQAAKNYLEFLADEVLWLQRNLEHLSPALQDGLRLLQYYLRIE